METTKRIVIMLILVTLAATPVQSAEDLSGTRTASCIVQITVNPGTFPLNHETIESLLRSSKIAGKAGREILNLHPEQNAELFFIEILSHHPDISVPPEPARGRRYEYAPSILDDTRQYDPIMTDEATPSRRSRTTDREDRNGRGRMPVETYTYKYKYNTQESGRTTRAPREDTQALQNLGDEQTVLFQLTVELPEEFKPAAKEFANALIENLRTVLSEAANDYLKSLKIQLERVNEKRDEARSQLAKVTEQIKTTGSFPEIEQDPETAAVYEQLEQTVDLSDLTPGTSFGELLDRLETLAKPPLEIQPNWRDLDENADIDSTTAAALDPMTGIKIKGVLKLLLKGLSSNFAELDFAVKDGVIMIATKDTLPSNMVTYVYEIPAPAYSAYNAETLIRTIRETIEPESWFEQSDTGEGTISNIGNKLVVFQTSEVHRKIQRFLQTVTADIPVSFREDIPADILHDEKRQLIREKRITEMEIAKLEARNIAIGEQIAKISTQMAARMESDHVTEELKRLLDIQAQQLEEMKKTTRPIDIALSTNVEEKITRTSIELAKRAEDIRKSAGGDQLDRFNNELADIIIALAEKRAELNVISNQLGQTENQLFAIYDPQIEQIRFATKMLQKAENRLNELNIRIADFQLPTVTVLGAD